LEKSFKLCRFGNVKMASLTIHLDKIEENVRSLKKKINSTTKIMAVVKANAYGLGVERLSKEFDKNPNINYLAVGRLEEAIECRKFGVKKDILVFANLNVNDLNEYLIHDLIACISDYNTYLATITNLIKTKKSLKIHIKVNTGMNRLGMPIHQAYLAIKDCQSQKKLILDGIFTHFASSDNQESSFTQSQNEVFKKLYENLKPLMPKVVFHAANSAAIVNYPETHYDLVRSGIYIYGESSDLGLAWDNKSTITLKAEILQILKISKGESVGYSQNYIAKRNLTIASIALGYADGFNRLLSNNCKVLIKGQFCDVIGNVSMDQVTVKIDSIICEVGDSAVIIGESEDKILTCSDLAKNTKTIPYEVLTSISARVFRKYT
jgi:alanine racemase